MSNSLVFQRSVRIERPAAEVFAWHESRGAFERLLPPWQRVQVIERQGGIRDGATVSIRMKVGPGWIRWDLQHRDYIHGVQFRDVQLRGPFSSWEHLHHMEAVGSRACVLTDRIQFTVPLGVFGRLIGGALVRHQLERLFEYRHRVTRQSLEVLPLAAAVRHNYPGDSRTAASA